MCHVIKVFFDNYQKNNPNNLMDLFTKLSLGITNADLNKIEVGSLE